MVVLHICAPQMRSQNISYNGGDLWLQSMPKIMPEMRSMLPPEVWPESVNDIREYILRTSTYKGVTKRVFYCKICACEIRTIDSNETITMKNIRCQTEAAHEISYYLKNDIAGQLKSMFDKSNRIKHLIEYCRQRDNTDVPADVHCGSRYKEYRSAMPLVGDSGRINLTLTLNWDGVTPHNVTDQSLWPVFSVVNEVPAVERHKWPNVLIHGLWHDGKPDVKLFINEIVAAVNEISVNGVPITDSDGEDWVVHVEVFQPTGDLPAERAILCMSGVGACIGCTHCYAVAKTWPILADAYSDEEEDDEVCVLL